MIRSSLVAVAVVLTPWMVQGCDLNPQPLPPGETSDASANSPSAGDASGNVGSGSDGGALETPSDGAAPDGSLPGFDAASPPDGASPADAGTSLDGSDGSLLDAAQDAPADATTDVVVDP